MLVAPPAPFVGLPRIEALAALHPLPSASNERDAPAGPQRRLRAIDTAENGSGCTPKRQAAFCQLPAAKHRHAGNMPSDWDRRPVGPADNVH